MTQSVAVPTIALAMTLALAPNASAQTQASGTDTQQPQVQTPTNLGGPGESCRARSDCKANLKCLNAICTDQHEGETCGATSDCGGELKCINNKCTSALSASKGGSGGGAGTSDWMKFDATDGSAHPFVGITLGGGFDTGGLTGNGLFTGGFNTFDGAFLFALNGGVFLGNSQLMFEIAPVTFVYDAKAPGPVFEMTANYAYFIPITTSGDIHVFWPLRFGAGMMAGPNFNALGLAYFQARADLIGPAFQIGHAIIDLQLPSFRYMITDKNGTQAHFLDWLFGMNVDYAF